MTSKEVSEKYNISSNNVRLFTNKRRSKGRNHDKRGRSPIIDKIGFEAIRDRYKNSFPPLIFKSLTDFEQDLKSSIRSEAVLCSERVLLLSRSKREDTNTKLKSKVISYRTVKRLVQEYKGEFVDFVIINNIITNKQ